MRDLEVNVLIRASKKTGKVDKVITGLGAGLLKMWALNNTTKTKRTLIFVRDTGDCIFCAEGKENDFPNIIDNDLGNCEDYGISLEQITSIRDDRFDK